MEILGRDHINTRTDAAAFAGFTRKVAKRKKMSGTKGEAKGRSKRVSYCPECPIPDMTHPETAPHVTVPANQRTGSCKNGHRWKIV